MGIKVIVRNPTAAANGAGDAASKAPAVAEQTSAQKCAAVLLKDLSGHADAAALAEAVKADASVLTHNLLNKKLIASADDKTAPHSREGAFLVMAVLAEACGAAVMPALDGAATTCIDHLADKVKLVAEEAKLAGIALMGCLTGDTAKAMVTALLEGLSFKSKWQTKEGCCFMLAALAKAAPDAVRSEIFEIVPKVSECMNNVKDQVKNAAKEAGEAVYALVGNRDIEQHLPLMLECIQQPAKVPDAITKLSATTFVQAIETPFLTIMCPLLAKGLRDKQSQIKRRSAVIIKNMAKLIIHPIEAMPFMPSMMPEVTGLKDNAADPDLREQGALAWAQLSKVEEAAKREGRKSLEEARHDDGEGEELCNCTFSLAYGGRILLNQTRMRLRRGRRYGLCGHNGAGKSTLMKAINRGMVEGFPPKDVLRTVYVAHDIDADESDTSAVDFIFNDEEVKSATAPPRDAIVSLLTEYGFTEAMQNNALSSLSGGWKMKLALARAILMKADILLLDEPTNHLDTTNVKWLEDFLNTTPDISVMVVSHDSGFLDNVTTDIIHYEDLKLVAYPGNLAAFVKVKPEAKAYYDLAAAATRFKFPSPGFLDGIKTRTQTIAKIHDATFTYPGAESPQIKNVSLRACMASRVAVLGRNGAGKSTLIKLLTGQADPDEGCGEVWKHPNLRMAYVAQHAFHHVEQHLDKTPSEYIWWRYALGEDREGFETVGRKQTAEEAQKRQEAIDAGDRVIEELVQRRKHKKGLEYEVKYVNLDPRNNQWLSREVLIEMGYEKMVNNKDASIASSAVYRPLTKEGVTQHLDDFGLEAEISNNNHIRGLSGGQKVKLVLASAMWNNPHMLVLDEPTNYLDRESLGGLANAINEYEGAVLMISHNAEFTKALCTEEWTVANHELTITGKPPWKKVSSKKNLETGEMEEVVEEDDGMKGLTPEEFAKQLEEKAARQAAKQKKAEARAAKIAAKQKEKFRKRY